MPHRCANCGKEFPSDHEDTPQGVRCLRSEKLSSQGLAGQRVRGWRKRNRASPHRERGVWPPWPAGRRDAEPDAAIEAAQRVLPGKKTDQTPWKRLPAHPHRETGTTTWWRAFGSSRPVLTSSISLSSPIPTRELLGSGEKVSYLVDLISMDEIEEIRQKGVGQGPGILPPVNKTANRPI